MKGERRNDKSWANFIAGAAAGAISKTCVAPLERIKILFQVQDMNRKSRSSPKYGRSILQCIRRIYTEESFIGFFKGNWANVNRVMPIYAIKFTMNEKFKEAVHPGPGPLSYMQLVIAASLAGITQISLTYPLELIRTRMTISHDWGVKSKSIFGCALNILNKEGLLAFYKGFGTCILSGAPYVAIQLSVFEFLNNSIETSSTSKTHNILLKLLFGSISGFISESITYCGDTVTRRMQSNGIGGRDAIYRTTLCCAKSILRKEGIKGFYRGFLVNVIRSIPATAVQLTAYDQIRFILSSQNQ